jgi:prevent-host-death family protein
MKAKEIGAFEAKTHLSELLERVSRGQVYVITRRGRPVAELRPVVARAGLRFGVDKGRITIGDDFETPVPDMREYGG